VGKVTYNYIGNNKGWHEVGGAWITN